MGLSIFDLTKPKLPTSDMCRCSECGWEGKADKCQSVEDQESWELPVYEYHVCPKCGSHTGIDDYWSSDELIDTQRMENK